MTDLKDIILDISLGEDEFLEEKRKESEEIEKIEEELKEEENKKEVSSMEESRFNNLLIHLNENLSKRFYKKTIKEIDSIISTNDVTIYARSWKIYILKMRAIFSIIKNKIRKYLINHIEKVRIKHHINAIKKYLNKIPIEFDNFYENNKNIKFHENIELINDLIYCYLEYILVASFFYKKIGNAMDAIGYLSLVINLYKETKFIPKTKEVFFKLEMALIFLVQFNICNENYFTAFDYLNIVMDMCFKSIIYQTRDLNDGVYVFDKNKYVNNLENKIYNIHSMKRITSTIFLVFLYRSICYENIGNIINAIKCDYQSIWFINHFYSNNFKYIYFLVKNILEKRSEFKNAITFIQKKIKYLENKQKNKKKEKDGKNERDHQKKSKSLFSKKFKKLVKKLENLKIPEVDLVNKFEEKKNLKGLNNQNIEGKDKNNFLYGVRLFNTFLREDFRPVIDNMKQIKSFDMDYQTQEKVQKFVRKLYFDQNQRKIKLNLLSSHKKNLHLSLPDFKPTIKIKKNILKKNRSMSTKNTLNNKRIFSAISRSNSFISNENNLRSNSTKNKSIDITKNFNLKKPLESIQEIKRRKIPKVKVIKLTSICDGKEVYKENEELNRFFNRNYLAKRAYIKKLEGRELLFQKYVLREKNHPKIPFVPYNKELMKQMVENKYHKILSLSVSNPQTWKENITKEEYHKIKVFNRLENIALSSLNNSALVKFKEEEKKMRENKFKYITIDDEVDNSVGKINKGNKSMIEKLNFNLDEINQRESIEIKNFQKLYEENKKYIKHRDERNSSYLLRKRKEQENKDNSFD